MAPNYSIYSIPVYWVLALVPHAYAVMTVKNANNKKWNNANPRGIDTNELYKKACPAEVFGRYERGEAAHKNLLENAPLFIGAVILGNMAGLPASTLNTTTGAYLGLRVLYIWIYINVTKNKYSYLRTAVWLVSTGVLFNVFVKAGNKFLNLE